MNSRFPPLVSRRLRALAPLALLLFAACSDRPAAPPGDAAAGATAGAVPAVAAFRVVAFGDSLTAGLGLDPREAYPALLEARLSAAGHRVEVVNAGVSGDTTAGGVRRVEWSLEGDVRVMIVALGANDGLRGLPVLEMRRNLAGIIERAQARRVTVILAGMEAPPNMGTSYTAAFRQVYQDLASQYRVALLPFLLAGVAGDPALNQPDGIHPNAAGARQVADLLWPLVESAVRATETR
jgi:acyl-CoA thioesterase-1